MRLVEYSDPEPAVNLALEEVLLDEVEHGRQPDTLRFWESPVPFVVLGAGQELAREVHEGHCTEDGVPIMRRCSAGGCVLQGPGSLNYSLFLTYAAYPDTASLHRSYGFILDRICEALAALGVEAVRAGISDIAAGDRKISGNAQRRRRNALLHHGTLLYRVDTGAMDRYLREPDDRPDYRGPRAHGTFLTAIDRSPEDLSRAVAVAFGAPWVPVAPEGGELHRARALASEKYLLPAWIRRR